MSVSHAFGFRRRTLFTGLGWRSRRQGGEYLSCWTSTQPLRQNRCGVNSAGESKEKSSFWLWEFMLQQHSCDMSPSRAAACSIYHLSSNPIACFKSLGGREPVEQRQRGNAHQRVVHGTGQTASLQFVGRVRTRYSGRGCESTDKAGFLNDSIERPGSKGRVQYCMQASACQLLLCVIMPCELPPAQP